MYPYFIVIFVARKLFKKWANRDFRLIMHDGLYKMHLDFRGIYPLCGKIWFSIFFCMKQDCFYYNGVFFLFWFVAFA